MNTKRLQKLAGILKEGYEGTTREDADYESQSGDTATMGNINEAGAKWQSKLNPEVNGIEIYNDGDNRLFVIFDKNTGWVSIVNDWNGEDFDVIWGDPVDIRPELLASIKGSGVKEDYHPDDSAGWDSAAARGEDDYEGEDEIEQPKYTVGTEVSSFSASWKVVKVYNSFTELEQRDPESAETAMMVRLHSRNNKESEEELMNQPWYGMEGTSMMSRSGGIDYKPQSALDNMAVDK
jgi:hypothetical protein